MLKGELAHRCINIIRYSPKVLDIECLISVENILVIDNHTNNSCCACSNSNHSPTINDSVLLTFSVKINNYVVHISNSPFSYYSYIPLVVKYLYYMQFKYSCQKCVNYRRYVARWWLNKENRHEHQRKGLFTNRNFRKIVHRYWFIKNVRLNHQQCSLTTECLSTEKYYYHITRGFLFKNIYELDNHCGHFSNKDHRSLRF